MTGLEILLLVGAKPAAHALRNWYNDWQNQREKRKEQERKAALSRLSATSESKQCQTSIAVLGMKAAGKTCLHCALRNVDYVNLETSIESYPAYTYKKKDGKNIRIKEGFDIGGGNDFRSKYGTMIKNADTVFFLFSLVEYRKNRDYSEETRSRLEFVTRKCKANGKNLVTLITHKDAFNQEQLDKAISDYKYDVILSGKTSTPYEDAVVKYKFYPINTTDRTEIRSIIDIIL